MKLVPKPVSANGSWVRPEIKLPEKTAIITGGNAGIGFWTAVDLASRGARVIIACRNAERAKDAKVKVIEEAKCPEDKVVVKSLDLASFDSIRKFAEDINATEERLDILINNAGVMMCPESTTEDGFETQFGVNHLGHFLLTNLLLGLLKKSAPSRVVVLTSIVYMLVNINFDDLNSRKGYSSWAVYSKSKLANLLFTRHLAKLLQDTGVTVNSLHPGYVDTKISRHVDESAGNYFWRFVSSFVRMPGVRGLVGIKTPEHGAQTSVYCAVAPELVEVSGRHFSECHVIDVTAAAKNDDDAQKLWEVSLEMTKLS